MSVICAFRENSHNSHASEVRGIIQNQFTRRNDGRRVNCVEHIHQSSSLLSDSLQGVTIGVTGRYRLSCSFEEGPRRSPDNGRVALNAKQESATSGDERGSH